MKKMIDQGIAIVLPMHNEADNVKPLIREIHATLQDRINFVIIVVEDGSIDATLSCLQELRHEISQLKIVRHRRNYGQSASVVSGVQASPYDWIVTLDGDGQNHPEDILKLVNELAQYVDQPQPILIAGNRSLRRDTWIRLVSSRIANSIRSSLLRDGCPDSGCGIKAFRRKDFLQLPYFNHVHRFLPALFIRSGGKVINIPVQHRPRTRGHSKYGISNRLWVGIVDLFGVSWLIRRPCQPEINNDDIS